MAANIEAKICVKIDIYSKRAICQEFFDLNESLAVPPSGHVLHLDCVCMHVMTLGEYKTCASCRGDLSVDETQEHLRRMLYGEYEVVDQQMQPQVIPPQQMKPLIIPPQEIQPQQGQPQMTQTLPPQPQPNPDILEVAKEVLDLAEAVLDLEQNRRGPSWASLERGTTPTSRLSDRAFDKDEDLDEDEVRI